MLLMKSIKGENLMSQTSSKLGNIYQLSDGKLFDVDKPSKLLEIQEAPMRIGQPQEYIINGQTARLIKRQLWTKRITIIPGNTGFRLQLLASRLEREAVFFNSFHKQKKLSKKEIEFKTKQEACEKRDSISFCMLSKLPCCMEACPELKAQKKRKPKPKEMFNMPTCPDKQGNDDTAICGRLGIPCNITNCPGGPSGNKKPRGAKKPKPSTLMDDFQISNELEWLSKQGYADSDLSFYQDLMLKGTYQRP
jgi:hypothetical protein